MSFDVMGPDAYKLPEGVMVLSNIYVGARLGGQLSRLTELGRTWSRADPARGRRPAR